MRDRFKGFYRPDEAALARLLVSGTVILDSSVLLNLYRFPLEAREDLLAVFRALGDRLWLPHHVGLEYQQNRLSVIAEQLKRFAEVRSIISDVESTARDKFERLQLKKRHSSISPDRFISTVAQAVQDFDGELVELKRVNQISSAPISFETN